MEKRVNDDLSNYRKAAFQLEIQKAKNRWQKWELGKRKKNIRVNYNKEMEWKNGNGKRNGKNECVITMRKSSNEEKRRMN